MSKLINKNVKFQVLITLIFLSITSSSYAKTFFYALIPNKDMISEEKAPFYPIEGGPVLEESLSIYASNSSIVMANNESIVYNADKRNNATFA